LEPWSTFAEVAGTAAASLIGLLFVAVSIRIDFSPAPRSSGTGPRKH
jgi:hypothetical protein